MRPDDLQFCTEKSSGVDTLGKFQFGDIVQIDNQNVGVIVRLERDAFQILNANVSHFFVVLSTVNFICRVERINFK